MLPYLLFLNLNRASSPYTIIGGGHVVVLDTFLGSAGVNLTGPGSHTGEIGATWAKQAGSSGDVVLTGNGTVRGNTQDTNSSYYASGLSATAEFDVEADFVIRSVIPNHYTALLGRLTTTGITDIHLVYLTDRFYLRKELNGTITELAQSIQTLTPGNTYHVKLQIRTGLTKGFLFGVEILSVTTPVDIPATGQAGLSFYALGVAPPTNTTGIQLKNFLVREVAPLPKTGYLVRQAVKRASHY